MVPGGSVEPDETVEEAAVREAKKETDLTVELGRKLRLFDDNGRPGHYFLVTRFDGEQRVGGPERERISPTNRYDLEYVEVGRLRGLDLRPVGIVAVCESGPSRRTRSG